MPSYLVTGASRGIGYEFLRQYSSDAQNIVIALVRDKLATEKKVARDVDLLGRSNIRILQADITDYTALKQAAVDTAGITGGSLDYIIANAGLVPKFDLFLPIGELGKRPEELTRTLRDSFEINVIGNIHVFNLFMPLILVGQAKKIITISSGLADNSFTNQWGAAQGSLYAASKAAMNTIVAKFNVQYKKDGVLFLALCPGPVEVGHYDGATEEELAAVQPLLGIFKEYSPGYEKPKAPEVSVRMCRDVIEAASLEKGDGGTLVSHYGNQQWV
ncbi:putative short chain dehydrogenase [Triangularia verruculosa]|uniref:Short chain dehydrogenase n=1 Tax=Triangularia verruculosa TaxID=2587418 RepID=A0AAN6XK07_9PEZI|nr:putative short chain dehydrogenase [Triangularia verruculosa]